MTYTCSALPTALQAGVASEALEPGGQPTTSKQALIDIASARALAGALVGVVAIAPTFLNVHTASLPRSRVTPAAPGEENTNRSGR